MDLPPSLSRKVLRQVVVELNQYPLRQHRIPPHPLPQLRLPPMEEATLEVEVERWPSGDNVAVPAGEEERSVSALTLARHLTSTTPNACRKNRRNRKPLNRYSHYRESCT